MYNIKGQFPRNYIGPKLMGDNKAVTQTSVALQPVPMSRGKQIQKYIF
jgi:hypothetical protein